MARAVAVDPLLEARDAARERTRLLALQAQLDRVAVSVDASLQEVYNRTDPLQGHGNGGAQLLGLSNTSASVAIPLFAGFGITSQVERAQAFERAADADIQDQRNQTALAAARVWWSLWRADALLLSLGASMGHLDQAEGIVAGQARAGLVSAVDVHRTAARRAQLQAERAGLLGLRAQAAEQLAVLLQLGGRACRPGRPTAGPGEFDISSFKDLSNRAHEQRPDVIAARARLAALAAEVRLAQAAYWPRLSVGALGQVGNNPTVAGAGARSVLGTADPFSGMSANLQAGVTLSVNLLDGGTTTIRVLEAQQRERMAQAELRALVRAIEAHVRTRSRAVEALHQQRQALLHAQQLFEDSAAILRAAHARGEASLFELLDTEVELQGLARQCRDVEAQLAVAHLELAAAVGDPLTGSASTAVAWGSRFPRSGSLLYTSNYQNKESALLGPNDDRDGER